MKKLTLITVLSTSALYISAQHQNPIHIPLEGLHIPIHMHFSFSNAPQYPISINTKTGDIDQRNTNEIAMQQSTTVQQEYSLFLHNAYDYARTLYDEQKNNLYTSCATFASSLKEHYILTTLGVISTSYLSALCLIYWHEYMIQKHCTWSAWNIDMNIPVSHENLYREFKQILIKAIQEEYCNQAAPTDFLTPLRLFMIHIEKEIQLLQRALLLHTFLKRTLLNKVLGIKEEKIAHISKLLKHAKALHEAFRSWCAEYNTTQVHKTNQV